MLTLQQIEKVYRTERVETVALHNINLDIAEGEFVSIMGPSGSGKSTLLNIMGLLDVSTGGRLILGGKEVTSFGDRDLARLRNSQFGFVFQTFHLIHDLSVVDNVEIPLLYRRR
jgi:putative ABC transport system ATP-binding protein